MSNGTSLVLFDIDGTLMRGAGRPHKDALVEGIRKVTGRSTTLDGIATAGALDRDLIAVMLRATGESERRIRAVLTEVMRECEQCYVANCVADLSPYLCRDVRQTLEKLKSRGAMLGLVTGNLSAIGWRKVELAGLRSYFSVGAFAGDGRTRGAFGASGRAACEANRSGKSIEPYLTGWRSCERRRGSQGKRLSVGRGGQWRVVARRIGGSATRYSC